MNRPIKFRAWDKEKKQIREVTGINWYDEYLWVDETPMSGDRLPIETTPLMQFTGLLDKNGLAEVFEGDIISPEGLIKGNIYESPQIYRERIDCLIETMGTKTWRDTESIAMGFGCKYAE
jgi:hypothetical protein